MSKLLDRFMDWRKRRARKAPSSGIIIDTPYGPTSEVARHQAALNMKADPKIKKRVEDLLIDKCGGEEAGLTEARRRYPEAYSE